MNLRKATPKPIPTVEVLTEKTETRMRVIIERDGRRYLVVEDDSHGCTNCEYDEAFHTGCPNASDGWDCDCNEYQFILKRIL